jgi:pilus assembly protein CpaF
MMRFTVTERGGPIRRLEFEKAEINIGRVQGNDIILAKGNVSKRHARIAAEEGKLVLYDLKSTNGTYVNGRRITEPHVLKPSDKVYIGDFVIAHEDGEIPVTAQRGSPEAQADKPVELEDPVADLARRRRREKEPVREEPVAAVAPAPPVEPEPEPPPRAPAPAPEPPPRAAEPPLVRKAAAPAPAPETPAPPREARQPLVAPPVAEPPRPASRASLSGAASAAELSPQKLPREEAPKRPSLSSRGLENLQPAAPPAASPAATGTADDYGKALALARRRLNERLDLGRGGAFGDDLRKKVSDTSRELIARLLQDGSLANSIDAELLHTDLVGEVVGLGPLDELLEDAEVSEVLVNNPGSIFVERGGKLTRVARAFSSSEALQEVLRRLVSRGGAAFPEDEPVIEARLPQGIRLTAVLPPFAPNGPSLVLRRSSRQARTLAELTRAGMLSDAIARFFDLCIRARRNVVFSGAAGAGKSSLLGAAAGLIPGDDRTILVEESAELALPQPHLVSLEARIAAEDGREATMRDLVRASVRLRPDWLVIGDCRGSEAFDLVQAMAGGRDGVLMAVQAHSPRDALSHLEAMTMMAAEAPGRGAREIVAHACHVIVQVARYPDGIRRVAQIAEVTGIDTDRPLVQEIFSFAPGEGRGRFLASGYIPRFVDDLTRRGVAVDLSIFRE